MNADQEEAISFIVNKRKELKPINDYAKYRQRLVNLQLFSHRSSAKLPSPAAIQLALLEDNAVDAFLSFDPAAPSDEKIKFDRALTNASRDLGEIVAYNTSAGNAFRSRYGLLYTVFETFVVLNVKALQPRYPMTHWLCTELVRRTDADSDLRLRLERADEQLVNAANLLRDEAPLDEAARIRKQAATNAIDIAQTLLRLADQAFPSREQLQRLPAAATNDDDVDDRVAAPQSGPDAVTAEIE